MPPIISTRPAVNRKLLNLIRDAREISKWIVMRPIKNATTAPIISSICKEKSRVMMISKAAPRLAGMLIRKLRKSAYLLSYFLNSKKEIVKPDLLRPGSMASP